MPKSLQLVTRCRLVIGPSRSIRMCKVPFWRLAFPDAQGRPRLTRRYAFSSHCSSRHAKGRALSWRTRSSVFWFCLVTEIMWFGCWNQRFCDVLLGLSRKPGSGSDWVKAALVALLSNCSLRPSWPFLGFESTSRYVIFSSRLKLYNAGTLEPCASFPDAEGYLERLVHFWRAENEKGLAEHESQAALQTAKVSAFHLHWFHSRTEVSLGRHDLQRQYFWISLSVTLPALFQE